MRGEREVGLVGGLSGCVVTSDLIKLADLLLEEWSLFKGAGDSRPEAHAPPAHPPHQPRSSSDGSGTEPGQVGLPSPRTDSQIAIEGSEGCVRLHVCMLSVRLTVRNRGALF